MLVAVIAVAAALAASAAPAVALAHDDSGGTQLPERAPAVAKDGEDAIAILKRIEGSPEDLAVAKDHVEKAWKAIARAQGAKLSGDEEGARLLSALALELAKGADAIARAAAAEKKADAAEKQAVSLEEKLERTRTLLAETDARRVQLTTEVEKARDAAKTVAPKKPATPPKDPKAQPAKAPPKAGKP